MKVEITEAARDFARQAAPNDLLMQQVVTLAFLQGALWSVNDMSSRIATIEALNKARAG